MCAFWSSHKSLIFLGFFVAGVAMSRIKTVTPVEQRIQIFIKDGLNGEVSRCQSIKHWEDSPPHCTLHVIFFKTLCSTIDHVAVKDYCEKLALSQAQRKVNELGEGVVDRLSTLTPEQCEVRMLSVLPHLSEIYVLRP